MLLVQKFGGSSLADGERICVAAQRMLQAARSGWQVVGVVSAQGNMTDTLIARATDIHMDPPPRELDAYLAAGEQMSAALVAMAVDKLGGKAVSLTGPQAGIITDGVHGNARILGLKPERIRRELDNGNIVVVAGFQGLGPGGNITTLGRGGSDTTAVALAAFLGAGKCMIYTDVDGIYDKDPRKYPDAVRFECISYEKMLRMAREGAQVLHDRCVELGMRYRVPIQVLSSFRPGDGTMVMD